MRFSILLIGLALIPVFAGLLRWQYSTSLKPLALAQARAKLAAAGLQGVDVKFSYLDAELTGFLADPEGRVLAEQLIDEMPGIRVLPQANQIKVAAQLSHRVKNGELQILGWLPNRDFREQLEALAKRVRPDIKVNVTSVRVSPSVALGPWASLFGESVPEVFQKLIEDVRIPASLSIRREKSAYVLKGTLPREALKEAVIASATASGWQIDASGLVANTYCEAAPFAEHDGLATFVQGLFASPTPGDFEIDSRNGPRLKAYATPSMEASLLSLLRPVSGATRVVSDITRVPSVYHFPDYKPTSGLPPERVPQLRKQLTDLAIVFESGSAEIPPQDAVKIGTLVALVAEAGPVAKFVVAGYSDNALEPEAGSQLRSRRVDAVRDAMIHLGAPPDALEPMQFEAVRPAGPLTDEIRSGARKVELLFK